MAFFFLAVGVWAATQSVTWTPLWPFNVIGGVLSYLPCVLWIAFSDLLPNRRAVLWPVAAVALILTPAIPFTLWGFVPGPPS